MNQYHMNCLFSDSTSVFRTFVFNMSSIDKFVVLGARLYMSVEVANPHVFSVLCGQSCRDGDVDCKTVNTHGITLSTIVSSDCYEFSASEWLHHPVISRQHLIKISVHNCQGTCQTRLTNTPFLVLTLRGRDLNNAKMCAQGACPIPAPLQNNNQMRRILDTRRRHAVWAIADKSGRRRHGDDHCGENICVWGWLFNRLLGINLPS